MFFQVLFLFIFLFPFIKFLHHLRLVYPLWSYKKECEQLRLVNFQGELDSVPEQLFEEDYLKFIERYHFRTYINDSAWYQIDDFLDETKENRKSEKSFLYHRDLQVFSSSLIKIKNPRKLMLSTSSKESKNKAFYAFCHKENVSRLLLSRRGYQHTHFKHFYPRMNFPEFNSIVLSCPLRKRFSFQTNCKTNFRANHTEDMHQWYRNSPNRF